MPPKSKKKVPPQVQKFRKLENSPNNILEEFAAIARRPEQVLPNSDLSKSEDRAVLSRALNLISQMCEWRFKERLPSPLAPREYRFLNTNTLAAPVPQYKPMGFNIETILHAHEANQAALYLNSEKYLFGSKERARENAQLTMAAREAKRLTEEMERQNQRIQAALVAHSSPSASPTRQPQPAVHSSNSPDRYGNNHHNNNANNLYGSMDASLAENLMQQSEQLTSEEISVQVAADANNFLLTVQDKIVDLLNFVRLACESDFQPLGLSVFFNELDVKLLELDALWAPYEMDLLLQRREIHDLVLAPIARLIQLESSLTGVEDSGDREWDKKQEIERLMVLEIEQINAKLFPETQGSYTPVDAVELAEAALFYSVRLPQPAVNEGRHVLKSFVALRLELERINKLRTTPELSADAPLCRALKNFHDSVQVAVGNSSLSSLPPVDTLRIPKYAETHSHIAALLLQHHQEKILAQAYLSQVGGKTALINNANTTRPGSAAASPSRINALPRDDSPPVSPLRTMPRSLQPTGSPIPTPGYQPGASPSRQLFGSASAFNSPSASPTRGLPSALGISPSNNLHGANAEQPTGLNSGLRSLLPPVGGSFGEVRRLPRIISVKAPSAAWATKRLLREEVIELTNQLRYMTRPGENELGESISDGAKARDALRNMGKQAVDPRTVPVSRLVSIGVANPNISFGLDEVSSHRFASTTAVRGDVGGDSASGPRDLVEHLLHGGSTNVKSTMRGRNLVQAALNTQVGGKETVAAASSLRAGPLNAPYVGGASTNSPTRSLASAGANMLK